MWSCSQTKNDRCSDINVTLMPYDGKYGEKKLDCDIVSLAKFGETVLNLFWFSVSFTSMD